MMDAMIYDGDEIEGDDESDNNSDDDSADSCVK